MSDDTTETPEAAAADAATATAKNEYKPSESGASSGGGLRKTRVGVVTSDKMSKTVVVEVVRRVPHPRFKKIIKRTTKLFAHDEEENAKVGDKVKVIETRPLSKQKRWRVVEVLSH